MGSKKYHDRAWLQEKYSDEILSTTEIAKLCDVTPTTILDWLDRHGIEKRTQKETQRLQQGGKHTDREWLAEQYHGKGRTLSDISDECGVDAVTIMNWMERYDIPRRSATQHKLDSPAYFLTDDKGYERSSSKNKGDFRAVKVHQLIAIAEGADPYKVFSNGDYHCHHKNGIKWDNRPENIEFLSQEEHANEHWPKRERAPTGEFL